MRRGTLVLAIALLLVLAAMFALAFIVLPRREEQKRFDSSGAERIRGTIKIAGDTYLGYWFVNSSEFKRQLLNRGYTVSWTQDNGNYPERHKKFADGSYDMIVLPISTYLLHGKQYEYPGVITFILSESRGADMIVGYKNRVVNQEEREPTVNDLNNAGLKTCFTPDSPSSFLLQTAIVHFALDELSQKGAWTVETSGSGDAYNRLRKGECDVAVLWEPDVSKALEIPGVVPIFGSDQIAGMIVDVFVVKRSQFDDPQKIEAFFSAYNETLGLYGGKNQQMLEEMKRGSAFSSEESLKKALDRIAWFDLRDNCHDWYGIGTQDLQQALRERVVDAMNQIVDVSLEIGDVAQDPLAGNPFSIINFSLLEELCKGQVVEGADIGASVQLDVPFDSLTSEQWAKLRVVGKMKIAPITFEPGTDQLTVEGQKVLNQVATSLTFNYPQYRILVKGHTSLAFNPEGEQANAMLSQERAEVVRNYLETIHGIHEDRLLALGIGGSDPPVRKRGEGDLSYRNRLPRVEFILLEDARKE